MNRLKNLLGLLEEALTGIEPDPAAALAAGADPGDPRARASGRDPLAHLQLSAVWRKASWLPAMSAADAYPAVCRCCDPSAEMSGLHCAVGLPNVGAYGEPRLLVELACQAETSGWDGVFIWDHLAYRELGWSVADPYISVAAIAARTSRVRVGVMIAALARRRPWKFAREMATLDALSDGRLIVGIGLGSQPQEEFAAFGEDPEPRRRHELVDEGLDIVCGLWSGQPFSYEGQHYRVAESLFVPSPIQRPRPPIWIGGRWPARRSFRRAARFDGVFPTFNDIGHSERPTPEQLKAVVDYTRSHRADQASSFDVVIEGQSDGPDHELLGAYKEVGLTWWVEKLGWFRGPLDVTRNRIEQGPPAQATARR